MEGMEGRNLFKKEREKHPDQKRNGYVQLQKRPENLYITVTLVECFNFRRHYDSINIQSIITYVNIYLFYQINASHTFLIYTKICIHISHV